jgi:hypothetical protein
MHRLMAGSWPWATVAFHSFVLSVLLSASPARAQEPGINGDGPDLASRQEIYRTVSDELGGFYASVETLSEAIDTTRFEIDALAAELGANPGAMLKFVQREIAFEPYFGSLRGAEGTLAGGAANALDRSLLLAELLRFAGFNAEIAQGRLSRRQAGTLLGRVGEPAPVRPAALSMDAALLQSLIRVLGVDVDDLIGAVKETEANRSAVGAELSRRAAEDAEFLIDRLRSAEIRMPPPSALDERVPAVTEHFWVRYQDPTGVWVDLDPSFPNLAEGASVVAADTTFAPDAVPERLIHKLRIRVTLQTAEGTTLENQVLIDETLAVPELYGVGVAVANQPMPSPFNAILTGQPFETAMSDVTEFASMLSIGGEVVAARFFTPRGDVFDNPPGSPEGNAERLENSTSSGFGGAGGALKDLFKTGGGAQSSGRRIASQWVDYELIAPTPEGLNEVRSERRTIYAAPLTMAEPVGENEVAQDMVWSAELMPIAGPMSIDQLGYLQVKSTLAGRVSNMAVVRRAMGLPVDATLTEGAESLPMAALLLATALTERLKAILPDQFPGLTVIWDRAQLVAFETRVSRRSDGRRKLVQGYDIIALNPLVVATEASEGQSEFAAVFGALANGLEWSLMAHRFDSVTDGATTAISNTGEVFRAAAAQNIPIGVIEPGDDGRLILAPLGLSDSALDAVDRALERNRIILAPVLRVTAAGATSPEFGWWQVDRESGELIGMTADGRGAGKVEYATLISQTVSITVGFGTYFLCIATSPDLIIDESGNEAGPQLERIVACGVLAAAVAVGAWPALPALATPTATVIGFIAAIYEAARRRRVQGR